MTESYARGRQQFYNISGIMLPEIADIELDEESSLKDICTINYNINLYYYFFSY